MSAVASNPVRVTVNPRVWIRHFKLAPLGLLLLLVLSVIAFLTITPEDESSGLAVRLRLVPLALFIFNLLYWAYTVKTGRMGDANPAVVIQTSPMLIGILANMSKRGHPQYALKIIKQPVYGADGKLLEAGSPLTAACEYADTNQNNNRWGGLFAVPVPCFTDNAAILNRVDSSLSQDVRQLLVEALRQIPERDPGIYFLGESWPHGSN